MQEIKESSISQDATFVKHTRQQMQTQFIKDATVLAKVKVSEPVSGFGAMFFCWTGKDFFQLAKDQVSEISFCLKLYNSLKTANVSLEFTGRKIGSH